MRIILALFLALPAAAQTISPDLFDGLTWRLIGPFRAGRSVAAAGVPGAGSVFYFGAVDGGVWKTSDAGNSWNPLFENQTVASVGALEVAPSDSQTIYVGTGESDIRSDLASGDGVYKSIDGGKTWRNVGLKDTRQISRLVVDPQNANKVYVAALGHAYAANEERGVFRSDDGGGTWKKVLYKAPTIGAADVALASDSPNLLFAALWEAHRPAWSNYAPLAGPGSGLYRSIDSGETWKQIKGHGFPETQVGRIGIAISRGTHGKRIYAAVESDTKHTGLYRSDDGGDSWALVNSDPRITSRAWYFSSITADPNDPDVLYIPNVALYKLSDGGKTLSIVRGAPGGDDYHQLWIDPMNSQHMVLATDQGTTVTLNGGVTWSTWYNQPTAQFYHVITDNEFPYHVYGSQQDSGTAATASRTDHGQIDARDRFAIGGSESGWIALDPNNPNIFYVTGTFGTVERFDRRTGQSQNIAPAPVLSGIFKSMPERKYRNPWTPVLVFSPIQRNALYLGTQYVMKTVDGGLDWQTISPDLTGQKQPALKAQAVTTQNAKELGYGTVYSIAPSPLSAAEIWAGSDSGLIHLTRDGGRHWSDVTPALPVWSKVTHIEVSHFNAGEAYAAVDRHRLDDMKPYLYRTRDYGKHWDLAVDGIPGTSFLNAVREDPKRQGLLYAATEFGVYVSFDDGAHWLSLQLNLPVTSVRDLVIHGDDLVIATHGRSFWILDDIAPLREIGKMWSSAHLFKPVTAVRIKNDSFTGTPIPPDEPQAKNPALGAYLDYYLRSAPQREVSLTILDSRGSIVRRFSSSDKPAAIPANLPIAPRWIQSTSILSTQPGMHRWVWDLRYGRGAELPSGDSDDEDDPKARGPLALPGTYQVKMSVDGRDSVQPLTVVMDPRASATPAELRQQFTWSQRLYENSLKADKVIAEFKAAEAGVSDQALAESIFSLQRTLNGLLAALQSADRMPTAQVVASSQETLKALQSKLDEWAARKKLLAAGERK